MKSSNVFKYLMEISPYMKTDYKQSAVDRKDERHTLKPEEEFRQPTKNKRDREVIIEWKIDHETAPKWMSNWSKDGWMKHKAYRNMREAEHALANLQRKSFAPWWQYRIKPEETTDEQVP